MKRVIRAIVSGIFTLLSILLTAKAVSIVITVNIVC